MPELQGIEVSDELIDFAGAGHDNNDPPEDDMNADPPPGPRDAPADNDVAAAANNIGDDADDPDDLDDDRSQILLSPRRSTVEITDNDDTLDEDLIDLNDILRDCIKEESFDKYQAAQNQYATMKKAMLSEGTQVIVGKNEFMTRWKVIDDILESDLPDTVPYFKQVGISGFNFSDKAVIDERGKTQRINFHELAIHLWPGDWKEQLDFINSMIEDKQQLAECDSRSSTKKVSRVSEKEFWKFFGLMLAGRLEGRMGTLWAPPIKNPTVSGGV